MLEAVVFISVGFVSSFAVRKFYNFVKERRTQERSIFYKPVKNIPGGHKKPYAWVKDLPKLTNVDYSVKASILNDNYSSLKISILDFNDLDDDFQPREIDSEEFRLKFEFDSSSTPVRYQTRYPSLYLHDFHLTMKRMEQEVTQYIESFDDKYTEEISEIL